MAGDIIPPVTVKFAIAVVGITAAIVLIVAFTDGLVTGYFLYGR